MALCIFFPVSFSFLSSFLSFTPSSISTGEVLSGHSTSFYSFFIYSCHIFYHLHLPQYQQGKCHLVILPLFPHHFFILFVFYIIYTFLHINKRIYIWALCLTYFYHIWRFDIGGCCFSLLVLNCYIYFILLRQLFVSFFSCPMQVRF